MFRKPQPIASLGRTLLTWYDQHHRRLPWRETRSPYPVWISEIMLQQTTVETVIPYWKRFIERLPDVEALAAATEDRVLTLWAGLGYYRRARFLRAAARHIVDVHGGRFPRTVEGLRALPGIGTYTAAAIASICFDVREPVVDGNVIRVLGRCLALEEDPRRGTGRRRIEAAAREILDPARPGDSNQALMEVGAMVCRPRSPRCSACPLAPGCAGRAGGNPETYPPPPTRSPMVEVCRLGVIVEDFQGRLLLRRVPAGEHNAGLWELPWIPVEAPHPGISAPLRRRLEDAVGFPLTGITGPVAEIRHVITRHRIQLRLHRARPAGPAPRSRRGWRWLPPAQAGRLALTGATGSALGTFHRGAKRVHRG
ncbi:MAG: A/G-specific adenine glycosylase [Acidobacteriota bacterium]|nr:A/G-specific adenine glycosylase [Acidobacteriota bacterium]MDQ7087060.1 A/G-specific adenine glycosylase [Acidobacteriota bacterium]